MYHYLCGWIHNPNQKCGCYRDKDGKVVRQMRGESWSDYRTRCTTNNFWIIEKQKETTGLPDKSNPVAPSTPREGDGQP